MLVVSNIDLTTNIHTMKPSKFLDSLVRDSILNINNDYRYMKLGYYVSLHAEILGNTVTPSSENIIDINRLPIILVRASKAGIQTPPYLVTDSVKQIISELGFPVIVFPVNPFSYNGFRIAKNRSALYRAVKSFSMNYKYAVCVEPFMGEMVTFKSIFGECELNDDSLKKMSEKFYETFRIPICRLLVQRSNGQVYLSGFQHLKMDEILLSDLKVIAERVSRMLGMGFFD